MKRTYQFKIRPGKDMVARFEKTLDACRYLYNACLFQRKIAYRDWNISMTAFDQNKQIPDVVSGLPEYYKDVHSQVLQDVTRRAGKSFSNFFKRVKSRHGPAGYPRYKSRSRYQSFTYPQSGWKLEDNRLILSGLGKVKMVMSRRFAKTAKVKTVTIKRDNCGDWFAMFSFQIDNLVEPIVGPVPVERTVGIDVGINKLAVLSDGSFVENPKFLKPMEKKLKRLHRQLSRKVKGSSNRRKAIGKLAREYRKLTRKRNDYLHKTSQYLVDNYDLIAFEDLKIKNMVRNHNLAKSILDGCWRTLRQFTTYKAEDAGKIVSVVEPKNTTRECSVCGELHKISLSERFLHCRHNNIEFCIDRDLNSGINIRQRAFKKLGWEPPDVKPVELGPLWPISGLVVSLGCETRNPLATASG